MTDAVLWLVGAFVVGVSLLVGGLIEKHISERRRSKRLGRWLASFEEKGDDGTV
jgi:hypothetical protein